MESSSKKLPKDNKEFFKFLKSKSITPEQKAIYGCIFGAFLGDAAGAFLEFFPRKIEKSDVQDALKFNGGGNFKLGKAQITDDSEMAMCILHGLTDQELWRGQYPVENGYPLNIDGITYYFGKWLHSSPFDLGITTRNALQPIEWNNAQPKGDFKGSNSYNVIKNVQGNSGSQSNGCLMRLSPLAIWGHKLDSNSLLAAVKLQTMLTHSNQTAHQASYLYCFAIQKLIQSPGKAEQAYKLTVKESELQGFLEMQEWFKEIDLDIYPPAHKQIGWLKIAFTQAFKFLKRYPYNKKEQQKYF